MDVAVFLGPSLSLASARVILPQATYLSPIKSGALKSIQSDNLSRVIIIDGIHDKASMVEPAEVLEIIDNGIEVWGGGGIGARLAAELSDQGMRGIGEIFSCYQNKSIQGDDEVAVWYDKMRSPVSDALINIRKTVARAHKQQIVSTFFAIELLLEAQRCHYVQRDFKQIAEKLATDYGEEGQTFLVWLATYGLHDQKQLDAIELLHFFTAFAVKEKTVLL